jgi:hypothetical protein
VSTRRAQVPDDLLDELARAALLIRSCGQHDIFMVDPNADHPSDTLKTKQEVRHLSRQVRSAHLVNSADE